ncbi:MAG: cation:proton antiporter [Thermomicrobiales bacterium]|nr:cation:proton antiporter [Thermomicrobiales bacterium]
MDDLSLVVTVALVLGAALVGGMLARRLGQPVLLGYIVAGAMIGPHTPGLTTERDQVVVLANLGVAFLMFALGLEFSLEELMRVRRVALVGGLTQIVLTLGLGVATGLAIGWPLPAAILLGTAFAISSSIVAIKLLAGRGEIEAAHGRIALGVGVIQDLSVVPMLALLPLLAGGGGDLGPALLRSVGVSVAALAAVVLVGTRLVPRLLFRLAQTGSRELFLMAVVVIALGTGLASQQAGLSFALGAFLAGIVVAESEFEGQVLAQIIPLRDLFASVFFVAVGMMVDPPFLLTHAGIVLGLVTALVAGKLLLTTLAMMLAGVEVRTAALVGTVLAQMGEFSFVLAGLGVGWGIVSNDQYGLMLSVALASILISSPLVAAAPGLLGRLARWLPLTADQRRAMGTSGVYVHKPDVIVCGYGRVGAELVQILKNGGFSAVVVDINPAVVRDVRAAGGHAIYGDAGMEPVLVRAGVAHARILALAIPDLVSASEAVRIVRRLNPKTQVIALAESSSAVRALEHGGVNQVVQPEFEVSLGFGRQVLRWLGVPAADARTLVADERDGFYALEHARSVRRARRTLRTGDAATDLSVAALAEQV